MIDSNIQFHVAVTPLEKDWRFRCWRGSAPWAVHLLLSYHMRSVGMYPVRIQVNQEETPV